jgi:hypothetical protein
MPTVDDSPPPSPIRAVCEGFPCQRSASSYREEAHNAEQVEEVVCQMEFNDGWHLVPQPRGEYSQRTTTTTILLRNYCSHAEGESKEGEDEKKENYPFPSPDTAAILDVPYAEMGQLCKSFHAGQQWEEGKEADECDTMLDPAALVSGKFDSLDRSWRK